jgi:kynurenine formamidase
MTNDAARLIVEKGVKTFGFDMTMVDIYTSPDWKPSFTLAAGGISVIMALVALNTIPKQRFLIAALPLNIQTVSFPIRVVAIVEQ